MHAIICILEFMNFMLFLIKFQKVRTSQLWWTRVNDGQIAESHLLPGLADVGRLLSGVTASTARRQVGWRRVDATLHDGRRRFQLAVSDDRDALGSGFRSSSLLATNWRDLRHLNRTATDQSEPTVYKAIVDCRLRPRCCHLASTITERPFRVEVRTFIPIQNTMLQLSATYLIAT